MVSIVNYTNRDVTVVVSDYTITYPRSGFVAKISSRNKVLVNVIPAGYDMMISVYRPDQKISVFSEGIEHPFPQEDAGKYYIVTREVAMLLGSRSDLLIPSGIISCAGGINCQRFETIS